MCIRDSGDNALIEPTVVFGLAGLGVHIGGQEAAAAHAGVAAVSYTHLPLSFSCDSQSVTQ